MDEYNFIPKPCNMSLTLQPQKNVEQSQGYNWLAWETETEAVDNPCHQLQKIQY